MTKLKISPDLSLPVDVAGEAIGVLATRGAGKSYTSAVLVEELFAAHVQFAVLDPTGVYWGLRAGADSKSQGLPVVVLGGAHGDVPLEPTAGKLIADVLVDTGQSLILDLSDFESKGAQNRFVTDLAERLYTKKARARTTLHLVVDEADEFAPQKPMRDEARMLGAMERIVRRGRSRGLGVTLITQRSAAVNKNVLDLVDTLVAMRMLGPRDREAVKEWIAYKEQRDELGVMASLPGLPTGTAWVWSPVRGILQKAKVRRIRTFDSYATPKPGEKRAEPRALAPIDVTKLGEQIQASAERAKADDPRELRRQIADLKKQLAVRPATIGEPRIIEKEVEVRLEVPVFPDEMLRRMEKALDPAVSVLGEIQELALKLQIAADRQRDAALNVGAPHVQGPGRGAPKPGASTTAGGRQGSNPRLASGRRPLPPPPPRHDPEALDGFRPSGPQQRILDSLAWLESVRIPQARKTQLALLADASPKSSAYSNNLGALRTVGLIQYPGGGLVALTAAGRALSSIDDTIPSTTEALQEQLYAKLPGPQVRILRYLTSVYPEAVPKEELAERAEASVTSSAYSNNLGALRSLGLIDYPVPGFVAALPVLFLDE